MVVNHDRRWIYAGAPKTGSSTLHCLLSYPPFGGMESPYRHDNELPAGCEDYTVIVSVRNPYSRAVSLYEHKRFLDSSYELSFTDFLYGLNRHSSDTFYNLICVDWYSFLPRIDRILRLESLHFDLCNCLLVNEPFIVPWENRITPKGWYFYYEDRSLLGLVADWARPDFVRYGYSI